MYITVEENIRINFDRFFEAIKFHGYVIEDGTRELMDILEENIIQEYQGQSDQIRDEGYEEGLDHGHESGYNEGYDAGFDEGYEKGGNDQGSE